MSKIFTLNFTFVEINCNNTNICSDILQVQGKETGVFVDRDDGDMDNRKDKQVADNLDKQEANKQQEMQQDSKQDEQQVAQEFEDKFNKSYMGYSNYFTWLMHLEVVNDEAMYLMLLTLVKQVDTIDDLAEQAKQLVVGNVPLPRNGNLYLRLLNEAFSAINWIEVVQFFFDTARDNSINNTSDDDTDDENRGN